MKTSILVTALCGGTLLAVNAAQAAPAVDGKVPAWEMLRHLTTTKAGKKRKVPQSIRKLGFKSGGGPARVQGDCTYGNDNIAHCEDCEVDWDDLTMICIANMICYDDKGKSIDCPPS